MQAQHVAAFSLQKSGTHLLQELMLALGYKIDGDACRIKPENHASTAPDAPRCTIEHSPKIDKLSDDWLNTWCATGTPRVIFNYRDPRDAMVSFANFLCGERDIGDIAIEQPFRAILRSLPNMDQRLDYMISDRSFPGHDGLRDGLWLLYHPAVCKVSYEELVGPIGGGNQEDQEDAVVNVMTTTGAPGNPADIARSLYNPDAFTFRVGRIGRWREHFKLHHIEAFKREYGDVLEVYGYEW